MKKSSDKYVNYIFIKYNCKISCEKIHKKINLKNIKKGKYHISNEKNIFISIIKNQNILKQFFLIVFYT